MFSLIPRLNLLSGEQAMYKLNGADLGLVDRCALFQKTACSSRYC
jgi:hypothetical protein